MTRGVDIGGTKISAVLMDGISVIGEILSIETPKTNPNDIISAAIHLISEIINPSVTAIGISSCGNINYATGDIISATDKVKEWKGVNLIRPISSHFSLPVFVENDGSLAAYAELLLGSGKGVSNLISITIGTGLGGGIIYNSKLIQNEYGLQANFHSIPAPDLCGCGERSYEFYISGVGLINIANALLKLNPFSKPEDVMRGITENSDSGIQVLTVYEKYLTLLISTISKVIPPEVFILGGGVVAKNKTIFNNIASEMQSLFPFPIKISTLDNNAGALGAALYAAHGSS